MHSNVPIVVRPYRTLYVVAATIAVSFISACSDDLPSDPTGDGTTLRSVESAAQAPASEGRDIGAEPVFDVALDVSGELKPGAPVRVKATVEARMSAPNAELALYLPELTIAKGLSPAEFRVPPNVHLPSQAERSLPLAASQGISLTSRQVVLNPGYYRAHVAAIDTTTPTRELAAAADGRWIQSQAHKEVWLLIKEGGGQVTANFNPDLIPEGMRPQPGPFRPTGVENPGPRLSELAHGATQKSEVREASLSTHALNALISTLQRVGATLSLTAGGAAHETTSSPYQYQVLYWDGNGVMQPLPGALVEITHYPEFNGNFEEYEENTIETQAITDSEGRFQVDCFTTYNNYTASVKVSDKFNILVQPTSVGSDNGNYDECSTGTNLDRQIISDSKPSHVYRNMKAVMDSSRSLLGRSRGLLQVELDSNAENSFYSIGNDQITIRSADSAGHVFGGFGFFVAGHEYGHAVHEKAIGGINPHSCPDPHLVLQPSNFSCALTEGFADYHGVATTGPQADWYQTISQRLIEKVEEFNDGDPVLYDPAEIEGAFAAFLFDITDPAFNEEQFGSNHDSVAYAGSYVADIIDSCQADGSRANGTDDVVYCFEQMVRSEVAANVNFFDDTSAPNSINESASEPSDWDLSELRSLWLENMYDYEGPRPLGG